MDEVSLGFGRYRLDLNRRQLLRDQRPVPLGSRALDVLCVLASARGALVTKDELMTQVWPGVVVEENNLQVHVSALRKALNPEESGQTCIVTVPGRGYRLIGFESIAPTTEEPVAGAQARSPERAKSHLYRAPPAAASVVAVSAPIALPLPERPSIAVLPFQNMSGDPEQEYFADGMVEDIITGLARIKWLFVIARNSTFLYKRQAIDVKEVGRQLGVRYVLEGSVRKFGNRVRVTGQLIDAASASHVWADRYDRALNDIFALQDELTLAVVGAIEPSLRQAEIERAKRKRPESLGAYDLYLRALPYAFASMPDTAEIALPLLEQAIAIQPDYAAAHAAIAFCRHARYQRGELRQEDKTSALCHARLAIANGGDDATALAAAASVIGSLDRDYAVAFSAFERALILSPSSALTLTFSAILHAWAGDDEIAVDHATQALRLSPFDSLTHITYSALAYTHFFAGRFEEAVAAASHSMRANPQYSPPCVTRIAALVNLGREDEARANMQHLFELRPHFTITRFLAIDFTSSERLDMLANALRRAGLPE